MDNLINKALLAHPMNWAIVWTVMLIGAYGWHILHSKLSDDAATADAA